MKDRDLRGHASEVNQVMIFQSAGWAETDGTDVPAAVAFDAFSKLVHPEMVSLRLQFCLYFSNQRRISVTLHFFANVYPRGVWTKAIALVSELSRAGQPKKAHLLLIELLVLVKLD
jgi:hypothetical protein